MTNVRCLFIMFVKLHAVCPGLSARGSVGPDQRRQNFVSSKPGSQESHALPQLLTPPPPGAVLLTAAIPPCYSPVRRWRAGDGLLAHQAEDGRLLLQIHGRGAPATWPHHRHERPRGQQRPEDQHQQCHREWSKRKRNCSSALTRE